MPRLHPRFQAFLTASVLVGAPLIAARSASAADPVPDPEPVLKLAGNFGRFQQAVLGALKKGDYDLVEAVAAKIAKDHTLFPFSTDNKSAGFYGVLGAPSKNPRGEEVLHEDDLEKWLDTRPQSLAGHLATAAYHVNRAWAARGSGFADTVTPEGWRIFNERIQAASELLDEARQLPGHDPDIYRQLLIVARCQSWDRDRVNKVVAELTATDPWYYSAHGALAELLLPRWQGEPGEMEQYFDKLAAKMNDDDADEMLARVAQHLRGYFGNRLFVETKLDAKRVARGLDRVVRDNPDAVFMINTICRMAMTTRDGELLGKTLGHMARLKHPWSAAVWGTRENYDRTWLSSAQYIPQQFAAENHLDCIHRDPIVAHAGGVIGLDFYNNTDLIVVSLGRAVDGPDNVTLWDVPTGHALLTPVAFEGKANAMSLGQSLLIVAGENGQGQARTMLINSFTAPLVVDRPQLKTLSAAGMSPGGNHYAFADDEGRVAIQAFRASEERIVNGERYQGSNATAFAFGGKQCAMGFSDGSCEIADPDTAKTIVPRFAVGEAPIVAVRYFGGLKVLCVADRSGKIHFRDVELGTTTHALSGPGELTSIAISGDQRLLASAHGEGDAVVLWDLADKKELRRFTGHTDDVTCVAFARHGKMLASGSKDGTIRFWDVSDAVK
ncbi:MAG: DUF4034 domain-containing protein [Planctomycetia bacterium]|nr:DUF4034 domain-containing protein [Planctomycetia bacterium]